MKRRTVLVLGWLSVAFAVIGTTFGFGRLYQTNTLLTNDAARLRDRMSGGGKGHAKHVARERRKARLMRPVWSDSGLHLNKVSGIVHWPNAKLFTLRYQPAERNVESLAMDRWNTRALHAGHAASIIEHLALRALTSSNSDTVAPIPQQPLARAISILETGLRMSVQQRPRPGGSAPRKPPLAAVANYNRVEILLARLIVLQHPGNPAKALEIIRHSLGAQARMPWLQNDVAFTHWHRKTLGQRDFDFVHRLKERARKSTA